MPLENPIIIKPIEPEEVIKVEVAPPPEVKRIVPASFTEAIKVETAPPPEVKRIVPAPPEESVRVEVLEKPISQPPPTQEPAVPVIEPSVPELKPTNNPRNNVAHTAFNLMRLLGSNFTNKHFPAVKKWIDSR